MFFDNSNGKHLSIPSDGPNIGSQIITLLFSALTPRFWEDDNKIDTAYPTHKALIYITDLWRIDNEKLSYGYARYIISKNKVNWSL